jgi:hypothetical protein
MLAEAVRVWTGWGKSIAPSRDDAALVNHFGLDQASRLLPILKSLEAEFYSSEAWKFAADHREMDAMVSEQFRTKCPGIPDDLVRAFAWCYTYDYK